MPYSVNHLALVETTKNRNATIACGQVDNAHCLQSLLLFVTVVVSVMTGHVSLIMTVCLLLPQPSRMSGPSRPTVTARLTPLHDRGSHNCMSMASHVFVCVTEVALLQAQIRYSQRHGVSPVCFVAGAPPAGALVSMWCC
jgi:hypothetical protein